MPDPYFDTTGKLSDLGFNYDVGKVQADDGKNTFLGKATKGSQLPTSSLGKILGPYLEGKDVFNTAKILEKANGPQAEQALAANFVARNTDGNPFNTSDTSEQKSFMADIQREGYVTQALKEIFPENESNSGFKWGDIG